MAWDINAASEGGYINGNQPTYDNAMTIMGWFWIPSSANWHTAFLNGRLDDNVGDYWYLGVNASDVLYSEWGGDALGGGDITTGAWNHLCWTKASGSSNVQIYGYVDGVQGHSSSTFSVTAPSGGGTQGLAVGYDAGRWSEYSEGVFAFKMWDGVQLSQAQIKAEMRAVRPFYLPNLYIWIPAWNGETIGFRDYSKNGRDFSEEGTVTFRASPPVPWGFYAPQFTQVAAAAGDLSINVSDTIASTTDTPIVTLPDALAIARLENINLSESLLLSVDNPLIGVSDTINVTDVDDVALILPDLSIAITPSDPAYMKQGVKVVG
jgi:hypothetical protein